MFVLFCLFLRNGAYCGTVTSTAYGYTLDRQVCLGYVQDFAENGEAKIINVNDFVLKNATYEIDIAGKRFPARAGIYPPKLASAAIIIPGQKREQKRAS